MKAKLFAVVFCVWAGVTHGAAGDDGGTPPKAAKVKFTVSKETTYFTSPLTPDGYVDYAGALNERLSRGVTPGNNAAVLFWRAHGPRPEGTKLSARFFQLLGVEPPPEKGDYFLNLHDYLRDRWKIENGDARYGQIMKQQSTAARRPWKAAGFPHLAAWLKANEKPLRVVREGAQRPRYFSPLVAEDRDGRPGPLIDMLLPSIQTCRGFGRALAARAMLHLGEGRVNAAWEDLMTCHRLGRRVGRGATLVEALVGIAIDNMAAHGGLAFIHHVRPDARRAAKCIQDLESLAPPPDMAEIIDLGERSMFLDSTFTVARGGSAVPGKMDAGLVDWNLILRTGNRWYDRLVKTLRLEDRDEMARQFQAINRDLAALRKQPRGAVDVIRKALTNAANPRQTRSKQIAHVLIALLIPAAMTAQSLEDRAEQQTRNVRIALALSAHRDKHGRYPARLSELAPAFLKKTLSDVFNGKPLIYRPRGNGYLLYSVGANRNDDQGRLVTDQPRGDDVGVRMPPAPMRP